MTTSSSFYDAYKARRHMASLDGLRFICISAVIWHHSTWHAALDGQIKLLSRGFLGVDFFFVLSGFLITTLLLREEETHGRFDLKHFYWRRLLRIVPVYFFVVGGITFVTVVVQGQWDKLHLLPYYLLFVSNFMTEHLPSLSITWSLSVEEQYYLVWPLLLLLVPRGWILPLLIALISFNLAVHAGLFDFTGITRIRSGPLLIHMPPYAPILMGSVVALVLNTRRGFALLGPLLTQRVAPLGALGLLVLALYATPSDVKGWPSLFIHAAMCLMLMSVVMREDHYLRGFLTNRLVARIGQISYGMYLYHLIVLTIIYKVLNSVDVTSLPVLFFAYYAATFVVAEISFRTLEAWFMGLRPRLQPFWARNSISS